MKIHIPTKQEKENAKQEEKEDVTTSSGVDKEASQETKKEDKKVNINTATGVQLETLPGIGPSTANKIIAYRKENGKFSKIEDIKDVSGIGEAKFSKIKDLICVK